MTGLSSRLKGQRGEREVAEILRKYGFAARRGTQYRGEEEPDVVAALPGCRIEVKRQERLNIWDALRQVDDAIPADDDETIPLLVFRRNRTRWYACLPLEDLLCLLAQMLQRVTLDQHAEVLAAQERPAFEEGRRVGYNEGLAALYNAWEEPE